MSRFINCILAGLLIIGTQSALAVTHKVGGKITGLITGKTLKLELKVGTALIASYTTTSNKTSYQFSVGVTEGKKFAVSIKTMPLGQYCRVYNWTQTMKTVNIVDVNVACGFKLGGTIKGLAINEIIKLKNNSGPELTKKSALSLTSFQPHQWQLQCCCYR